MISESIESNRERPAIICKCFTNFRLTKIYICWIFYFV